MRSRGASPAAAERYLHKLEKHPDKAVTDMAHEELNLAELRKTPLALQLPTLAGGACDFAALRGKVVLVIFWAAANEGSKKELLALRDAVVDLVPRGLAVVAVSYDKSEGRAALEKTVAEYKLAWPVVFEGKEAQSELGEKLNVRRVPAIAIFDQKGFLVATGLRANRAVPEVKRLLGVKDEPAPQQSEPTGGGSSKKRR